MEPKKNKMKILIVDDDERIVRSTKIYLKTKGFSDIDSLTDSRKVIKQLTEAAYDVLILDLNMPYISGYTIMKEVSNLKLKTKIFIISAMDNDKTISQSMHFGASYYFTKPIDNNKLINKLTNLKEDKKT